MTWRTDGVLEIENPLAECGYCHFCNRVRGEWSVEEGRLVFRADLNPLPGRGPDLESCCEGYECGDFAGLTLDYRRKRLSDEEFAALKASAEAVQKAFEEGLE